MSDGLLIDGHTHPFPDEAYGLAWQEPAGHTAVRAGTVPELDRCMRRAGIDRAAILLFPRSNERYSQLRDVWGNERSDEELRLEVVEDIHRLNRWGCELAATDSRFIPFVGVNARFMHPDEMITEIEELVSQGARGVKIIPPAMQLYANDPLLWPVYEFCARGGIPLLSQSGSGGVQPADRGADPFGRPKYFGDVLAAFPDLTLILAHMGRGYEQEVHDLLHHFPRVYTDTSLRLGEVRDARDRREIVSLIRAMGTDRVIFGSNFPLANPVAYADAVRRLPFSPEEQRRLFSGNFLESVGS